MEIAILITFILGWCICIVYPLINNNKLKKIFMLVIILSMMILYMLGESAIINKKSIVPAIEVYRGNTTLQITYQDSIPIDSVVIYKNK